MYKVLVSLEGVIYVGKIFCNILFCLVVGWKLVFIRFNKKLSVGMLYEFFIILDIYVLFIKGFFMRVDWLFKNSFFKYF